MQTNSLHIAFKEAYKLASKTHKKLAPDIMLQLYAHYKQATKGNNYVQSTSSVQLRNDFKLNAWVQLNHLSETEAKQAYINLVAKYIK